MLGVTLPFILQLFTFVNFAFAAPFDLPAVEAIAREPGVKTVEDFLARTPGFMRADGNFAVAYNPHGLVSGSPQTPSLLLFGNQNSFVEMVVTSRPTSVETIEDAVEILAFDPISNRHELARISFRKEQSPRIEIHPHKCLVCHGDSPKPLWRSAFQWEGFFGAAAGAFTISKTSPAANTRIDEQSVWKQIVDQPGARFSLLELKKKDRTTANLRLTEKLAIEHSFVVAEKIMSQKPSRARLAKLIAALALCEGDAFYERDVAFKELGLNPKEWYLNSQLKPDSAQSTLSVPNESFQFGEGPLDSLLISQLISRSNDFDARDFVRHQPGLELRLQSEVSPLMPNLYVTPVSLEPGRFLPTPKSWCTRFREKYAVSVDPN